MDVHWVDHSNRASRSPHLWYYQLVRNGGNPYPPHSGARYHRYRCSLPGLAGFTVSRREGTDTGHHRLVSTRLGAISR